jgi:hypothetical protein
MWILQYQVMDTVEKITIIHVIKSISNISFINKKFLAFLFCR